MDRFAMWFGYGMAASLAVAFLAFLWTSAVFMVVDSIKLTKELSQFLWTYHRRNQLGAAVRTVKNWGKR